MNAPRTSIRRKLVTAIMLTSTTVLLLTGGALVVYDVVTFRQTLVSNLTTRAGILSVNAAAALAFQNPEDATQVLGALKVDPRIVLAALYDREGRLFATYPPGLPAAEVPPAPSAVGHAFDASSVAFHQPVVEEGRTLGSLYLRSDLRALDQRFRVSVLVVLLAIAGSIGVALLLSTWLQRGIVHPVRTLAEAARTVSETKDYSIRTPVPGDDELGLLTRAFNDMLSEIQRRDLERRQAEDQIRMLNSDLERRVSARTAELQASNEELEAFSYSVSHDLRAPLRHVDGFADLLQRHAAAMLDEKGRRYLQQISESAKSMGALIDDLLAFSRMGRTEMRQTAVELDPLVADVREELSRDTDGREVVWEVASLPEVQGDPAMLRLALVNLLSNAVKYTRGRTPARIEVGSKDSDHETVVFIRDNGAGFDMAYQHKLFGVFQRLHNADDFEGTGIGLANVRRIVQRHGGRVWAESAVGQGATFFVALPKAMDSRVEHREAA